MGALKEYKFSFSMKHKMEIIDKTISLTDEELIGVRKLLNIIEASESGGDANMHAEITVGRWPRLTKTISMEDSL